MKRPNRLAWPDFLAFYHGVASREAPFAYRGRGGSPVAPIGKMEGRNGDVPYPVGRPFSLARQRSLWGGCKEGNQ